MVLALFFEREAFKRSFFIGITLIPVCLFGNTDPAVDPCKVFASLAAEEKLALPAPPVDRIDGFIVRSGDNSVVLRSLADLEKLLKRFGGWKSASRQVGGLFDYRGQRLLRSEHARILLTERAAAEVLASDGKMIIQNPFLQYYTSGAGGDAGGDALVEGLDDTKWLEWRRSHGYHPRKTVAGFGRVEIKTIRGTGKNLRGTLHDACAYGGQAPRLFIDLRATDISAEEARRQVVEYFRLSRPGGGSPKYMEWVRLKGKDFDVLVSQEEFTQNP